MNVKELIEKLEKMPPDAKVVLSAGFFELEDLLPKEMKHLADKMPEWPDELSGQPFRCEDAADVTLINPDTEWQYVEILGDDATTFLALFP